MSSTYLEIPKAGGGGTGAVDSVFGRSGSVTAHNGDYTASQVINVPAGVVTTATVQAAINELGALVAAGPTGNANAVTGFDGSGNLESIPNWNIDTNSGGFNYDRTQQPNDGGGATVHSDNTSFDPLKNSPNEDWNIKNTTANFDVNGSGFTQGTAGEALTMYNGEISHQGTGNVGSVSFTKNYFDLGNGTDPISVKGMAYQFGFGDINSGVTVNGDVQGYGFQPTFHAGSVVSNNILSFYDFANFSVPINNYTSFAAGPNITGIRNNNNFTGMGINPTITTFSGNAGFTGVGLFPTIGAMATGGYQGFVSQPNIGPMTSGSFTGFSSSPTIVSTKNATGIDINMSSVTPYPGAKSSLTIQDLFLEFKTVGDNNNISVQYVNDGTAGSETAALSGNTITVHIQSGVSTATQVRAALLANFTIGGAINVTITGTASNPQVTYSAHNLAGGENLGNVKAANFTGDVSINGSLSFSGGLSIGKLNAFSSQALADNGGGPASVHQLITQPTVADNVTVANADLLGVNTAALINIGSNAHVTTSLLGVAALGLPAVLSMGTGSTVDVVAGAVFALSLDSSATGGTVDTVALCKSLAIPNGATTVNRLYGYQFSLPFGSVGTDHWGFYTDTDCDNWFKGSLKLGGTAGSTDKVTNSDTALEIGSKKAFRNSNLTTVEKLALTATSGMQVFDSTLNKLSYYNGAVWVNL